MRSFLGLVQYSAKFLPNFAEVTEPLRIVTRKDQKFVTREDQEEAFRELKKLMTSAETLAYFKNDCKTRVVADAGPTGLGAVLTQLQDGQWRVVAYASRNLTAVERRYSQTEKEALALVWACERFHLYMYGREFELETDHKPHLQQNIEAIGENRKMGASSSRVPVQGDLPASENKHC